ncbi:33 kDa ribonucleoprotein, chloroplastic isoform X1 [Vigna unguiculata]|uniref:33 kDa ribonucleoprotein, chloroplastic isoform X1 n=1 Tax=Vigna unguiculata TaxID=3917 RepID=UPI001016C96F|nr:33 kDa ribonucleoprotein, chloroplastic isoform X1 [Vigna unguiculata]
MAAAASFSSSICNRIYNLSLTHSSISRTSNFPQRPIFQKPLNLNHKSQNFSLSFLPLHRLSPPSATFDGSEVGQDITESRQDEPVTETSEKTEQEAEQKVSDSNDNEAGRLYIGNLPYSITNSQLEELFGEAGTVLSVEIVYDRVTSRSRGFAFVTMASVEDAKEAIRMFDGSQVGGRTAKVNFPEVPKGGERLVMAARVRNNNRGFVDSPYKIYCGNLGWGVNSQSLREAFAEQPGVLSAKVVYEKDSGRSRGFGFVSFTTAESAAAALDFMNGLEVQGRPLRLNMAETRTASSPPVIGEDSGINVESSELVSSART